LSACTKNIPAQAIAVFLVTLALCLALVFVMVFNRVQVERLTMEHLVLEKGAQVNATLSRLLMRTQILSFFVAHSGGDAGGLAYWASLLIDDPAILNLLIAPGGVVSYVYPLEGNEAVLGLDFFNWETAADATVARESLLLSVVAKETCQLVMGGPFVSVQGWEILVGRHAVFLKDEDGGGILLGHRGHNPEVSTGAGRRRA